MMSYRAIIQGVMQRIFASLYHEGAAAGSGEDAELLFAHLSAAAHTTKNMGVAGKLNCSPRHECFLCYTTCLSWCD